MTDWKLIRDEYENGASLRSLAGKYGISKSVIGKRKYDEKWTEAKRTDTRTTKNTQEVIRPDMNAAVRATLGFKLRFEENKTWEDVASGAGYASRGAARNAVLRESQRHISHAIQEVRDMEQWRIEQLQMRCFLAGNDKENGDYTWAIDRFVALSKRKSELLGMDTPIDSAALANITVIREVPAGYLESPHEPTKSEVS